jgi:hypothetical protein
LCGISNREGTRWDFVQGSKLKVQDLLSKESSASLTTIHKEDGELEEASDGEG